MTDVIKLYIVRKKKMGYAIVNFRLFAFCFNAIKGFIFSPVKKKKRSDKRPRKPKEGASNPENFPARSHRGTDGKQKQK